MADEYTIQQRLGAKVPRSILWSPYMALNPYYTDLSNSIDVVWGNLLDNAMTAMIEIRNVWITNPDLEAKVYANEMLDLSDWSVHERETMVKQVNMLGMQLTSAGVLTDINYQTISRWLGQYWFGKGTQAFIDFINFCLITDLTVSNFWSENTPLPRAYNNMTLENADGTPPGTPVWEGGTWFPTTHVQITANGGLGATLTASTLAEFFYEIANYNLVLNAIEDSFNLPVVGNMNPDDTDTDIVAVAMVIDHAVVMSTIAQYGATSPTLTNLVNAKPSRVLTNGAPDFNAGYMLMAPSSWYEDNTGHKVGVYTTDQIVVQSSDVLPTSVMGDPISGGAVLDPGSYITLMGPVNYIAPPGITDSAGLIAVWSAVPTTITTGVVGTRTVGTATSFLTNPVGWLEVSAGLFTPYW